jgi:SPP1 gp7 family putative phage head morphogenesis protein
MNKLFHFFFAFKLKPAEAVRYFKEKGLKLTQSWRDLWKEAHAKAFTVAHCAKMDVLLDIHEGVRTAIEEGITSQEFIKRLKPLLQAKGWWGKAIDPSTGEITESYPNSNAPVQYGSTRRLQLIYQQNLQVAYMTGRYIAMKEGVSFTPFWQYVAVMDASTRDSHAKLNKAVWKHDDPIWDTLYPPNGWNCRCRVRPLSQKGLEREGLTVRTSDGMSLAGIADEGWNYHPGKAGEEARQRLLDRTRKLKDIMSPEAFEALQQAIEPPTS